VNRFFGEDVFDRSSRQVANSRVSRPSVNIKENDDGYMVEVATPGLAKEDLVISVDNAV
jgi:HSP20 family protein